MQSQHRKARSWHRKLWRPLVVVPVVVVLMAGSALAAWLLIATGSTTSTDTTGTASTAHVTVTAMNRTDGLEPGATATIPVSITNGNSAPVRVSAVTVSVTGTSSPGCTASWFTIVTAPMFKITTGGSITATGVSAPFTLPAGAGAEPASPSGDRLALSATAPTTCQGVTINLAEKVS